MPPPKPPLTAISEPDPIYPYLPFLFWFALLAMTVPTGRLGAGDFENNAFPRISLFSDVEEIVRNRTKMR